MWKAGYDPKAIVNDADDDDWETDPDFVVSICTFFDQIASVIDT